MTERAANIRMQAWVLAIGALLMAVKFLAFRLTHSTAILSDALESIVNVGAGAFTLYSLVLAAKPRDRGHPYGHGKVEFISATVEGTMVALAGALIVYRAISSWVTGTEVHELEDGIVLVGITGAANALMGYLLIKRGKRNHSLAMEAEGTHLLSDTWSSVAVVLGLVVIHFTGLEWLDNLFALLIAAFIIRQGIRVVRRSIGGIMDEVDEALAAQLVRIVEEHRRPTWIDLHNFRMIKFGSTLHIDCHLTVPWYFTVEAGHREISALAALVNERSGREVEFFIHMDPCVPRSCSICEIADCPVRQAPFVRRIPWNLTTVLMDKKHGADSGKALA
jgi:cation diffusion facilitator family transporter